MLLIIISDEVRVPFTLSLSNARALGSALIRGVPACRQSALTRVGDRQATERLIGGALILLVDSLEGDKIHSALGQHRDAPGYFPMAYQESATCPDPVELRRRAPADGSLMRQSGVQVASSSLIHKPLWVYLFI